MDKESEVVSYMGEITHKNALTVIQLLLGSLLGMLGYFTIKNYHQNYKSTHFLNPVVLAMLTTIRSFETL